MITRKTMKRFVKWNLENGRMPTNWENKCWNMCAMTFILLCIVSFVCGHDFRIIDIYLNKLNWGGQIDWKYGFKNCSIVIFILQSNFEMV